MKKFYVIIMLIAIPTLLVGAAARSDIYGYSSRLNTSWSNVITSIEKDKKHVNDILNNGERALAEAVKEGNVEVVSKLIQLGARVTPDRYERSPIGMVIEEISRNDDAQRRGLKHSESQKDFDQYLKIIEILAQHGASLQTSPYVEFIIKKLNPAHSDPIYQILSGLSPEDYYPNPAFSYARKGQWYAVYALVKQKKIDVNKQEDKSGWSLLGMASEAGNEDAVKKLLDLGANPNAEPKPLYQALMKINQNSHTLHNLPLDPSWDHRRNQEIQEARRYLNIITTLVEHGATPTAKELEISKNIAAPLKSQVADILPLENND